MMIVDPAPAKAQPDVTASEEAAMAAHDLEYAKYVPAPPLAVTEPIVSGQATKKAKHDDVDGTSELGIDEKLATEKGSAILERFWTSPSAPIISARGHTPGTGIWPSSLPLGANIIGKADNVLVYDIGSVDKDRHVSQRQFIVPPMRVNSVMPLLEHVNGIPSKYVVSLTCLGLNGEDNAAVCDAIRTSIRMAIEEIVNQVHDETIRKRPSAMEYADLVDSILRTKTTPATYGIIGGENLRKMMKNALTVAAAEPINKAAAAIKKDSTDEGRAAAVDECVKTLMSTVVSLPFADSSFANNDVSQTQVRLAVKPILFEKKCEKPEEAVAAREKFGPAYASIRTILPDLADMIDAYHRVNALSVCVPALPTMSTVQQCPPFDGPVKLSKIAVDKFVMPHAGSIISGVFYIDAVACAIQKVACFTHKVVCKELIVLYNAPRQTAKSVGAAYGSTAQF